MYINAGDEEGADITFEYNAKRITISIFTSLLLNGGDYSLPKVLVENRIISLLNNVAIANDEDYNNLINKVLDSILYIGGDTLSRAAPPN